eukprot:1141884-Pelagomonas_calceolata.AAC.6
MGPCPQKRAQSVHAGCAASLGASLSSNNSIMQALLCLCTQQTGQTKTSGHAPLNFPSTPSSCKNEWRTRPGRNLDRTFHKGGIQNREGDALLSRVLVNCQLQGEGAAEGQERPLAHLHHWQLNEVLCTAI